jgi:hypothetical protein
MIFFYFNNIVLGHDIDKGGYARVYIG